MKASHVYWRATVASVVAVSVGMAIAPVAAAQLDLGPVVPQPVPAEPAVDPVQVAPAGTSDNANPAAVEACGAFAQALDGTAQYYGEFADALENYERPDYSDPAVTSSNSLGRTALRQGAGVALDAANTPGLAPEIASPMRAWSLTSTKLLVKMGLHTSGSSLNDTAAEMNTEAEQAQAACAAAGTHA